MQEADLSDAENITCDQLTKALNWQSAYRDPGLACGAPIPENKRFVSDEIWDALFSDPPLKNTHKTLPVFRFIGSIVLIKYAIKITCVEEKCKFSFLIDRRITIDVQ
ncbi:MAG: hypothetical protein GY694_21455 [Gammaproteobacteria bacterium]|nr:hypothetical protein [Gammaproteobacteria bacterium]